MTPDDIAKARGTIEELQACSDADEARFRPGQLPSTIAGWSAALDEVERLRGLASGATAGHVTRVRSAIHLVRTSWRNDGAEGKSVHLICDEVERQRIEHALRAGDLADAIRGVARERDEATEEVRRLCAEVDRLREICGQAATTLEVRGEGADAIRKAAGGR